MTPAEVAALVKGKKVIIHRGNVFLNTRTAAEVDKWTALGARCVPWYVEEEKVRNSLRGWEVHLTTLLTPIYEENSDGDEVNVAPEELRRLVRKR